MPDLKAVQFFEKVLSKTKDGKIHWEKTAGESDYIAAIGGKFTLSITEYESPVTFSFNAPGMVLKYALLLKDHDGRVLMRVTDENDGITSADIAELYDIARRQALHVDEKIDSVLGELSKL